MKKLLAAVLVMLMVISVIPMTALAATVDVDLSKSSTDYYSIVEKSDYVLASGATETEFVLNNAEGTHRNVVRAVEVDLSNPNISLMPTYKNISEDIDLNDEANWGAQIMSEQVKHIEDDLNLNVVAGMNVSLSWGFDHPFGLLIYKGKVLYDDRTALNPETGAPLYPTKNSEGLEQNAILVIKKDGTAEFRDLHAPLTGDEWMAQIVCMGWLVKDGQNLYKTENHTAGQAARSVIGIKADGSVVLMQNDGRQAPYSSGFTGYEMAEMMISLGCVQAVNCDGGGSSTFISRRAGEAKASLKSRPSDGNERATIHGIAVISNTVSDGIFESAILTPDTRAVTPGTKVEISVTGADKAGVPTDIPEDLELVVADEDSGSFDEDGYFVAGNKFGDAVINAVSGGEVVGTTTISIIAPDSISFVEDSVAVKDIVATAGRPVYLPVVGYFGNKPISVNEEDVVLSVANEADGTFDGFNFTPNETYSGAKAVEVTATLKADPTKTATIIVYVYGQTEVDFDFNNTDGSNYKPLIQETVETTETISFCKKCNKTAGTTCKIFHRSSLENRTQTTTKVNTIQNEVPKSLAWNRDIRHTVEDVQNATYTGTRDPYKTDYQLVYTIGVDVTKVNLPSGSDTILKLVDSAGSYENAWDTMCSLAPRITTDTTITVQVEVSDKDAEVNLDDMFILSDFFEIKSASVDDNNIITIVINWKVQYSAVDPTTENPIVVVGGIKCKFPDKARNGSYNIKTLGSLAYHVCMLTSTGYKYAGMLSSMGGGAYTKSEGAQSGQNSDQGIYIDKSNVISYEDSFTLLTPWQSGVWKDGRYYIDNELATGIQYAPTESDASVERYYDFGEDGTPTLYNGRLTHEGLLCDVVDGVMHPVSGWQDDNCYYVDGAKLKGPQLLPEKDVENATEKYCYNFDRKGKYLGKYTGLFNDEGTYRYSYLGKFTGGWQMIDDEWYYFDTESFAAVTGEYAFDESRGIVYELDETGKLIKGAWYHDGLGYKYYYGPTDIVKGLHTIEGKQYYFMNRHLCETGIYYMELATGNGRTFYQINENNEFVGEYEGNGLIECVDGLYYGIDGKPQTGLFKVDGYYYYFNVQYKAVKSCNYNVSARNGLTEIPYGVYQFDADGKLIHKKGIFTISDNMYYYENSTKSAAGLIKVDGDYYYAKEGGLIARSGTFTVNKTSCDLPAGEKYKFGADGKMLNGLVNEGKYTFYYENGKRVNAGLVEIDGDYYYIDDNCLPKTNGTYTIKKSDVLEIPVGSKCKFDAEGKMYQGLYEEGTAGNVYYYKNGQRTYAGLIEIDGNIYYAKDGGLTVKGGIFKIEKSSVEGIEAGIKCKFHKDGKMYDGIESEGTNTYYYEKGQRAYAGLVEIDGNIYYAKEGGLIAKNGLYKASKSSVERLQTGVAYKFDAEGKMLQGIVEEGTNSYYYVDGKRVAAGLVEFDGNIYYAKDGGLVAKNGSYKATASTVEGLETGVNYKFDADGKAYQGLVDEGEYTYYYENGRRVYAGLVKVDGDYYCVNKSGIVIKGEESAPAITSCDLPAGVGIKYSFGADGKMLQGIVDGYYYKNGQLTYAGLVQIGEDYYYIGKDFKPVCGKSQFAIITNCDLAGGETYTFDADGKMVK